MSAHVCHAEGCAVEVPRRIFMCPRHWRMLPRALQRLIYSTYTPGQENHLERVTTDYLDVAMVSVNVVAVLEHHATVTQ